MKFTVVTYGTEGDTRPLAALCRGLIAAEHSVHLFADRSTLPCAVEQQVPATALAGDMKASIGPDGAMSKLMKEGGDVTEVAKAVARIANENTAAWMKTVIEDAADSDAVLFSGLASYLGLSVGEKLNVPAIGLGLFPISPTCEFPSPFVHAHWLPNWANRFSHRAVNALLWQLFKKKLNEARREVCQQAPRKDMWQQYPPLYGISSHLVPQPRDWPEIWRICGEWHAMDPEWTPPEALSGFLDAGEPPIYIGFGSMAGFNKSALLSTIIAATAGRRVLFYPGWSGIDPAGLPENFAVVGPTPHDWLFPRVAMVIHHGGAGTTHTACRAGVPSIVIPFAADQFFWAKRLEGIGVAPPALSHTRIHAGALAEMIAFAERPEVRRRAADLGGRMRQDSGIERTVRAIEEMVSR